MSCWAAGHCWVTAVSILHFGELVSSPSSPGLRRTLSSRLPQPSSRCAAFLPYLCCRSLPHLLSMRTGGGRVPQALQFPFSYSPKLQMKSRVPFSQFNDECREGTVINSEEVATLHTTTVFTLWMWAEACRGCHQQLTHSGTFQLVLSKWGFWFRRIYPGWHAGFLVPQPPPKKNPKLQICIQWDFPALLSARNLSCHAALWFFCFCSWPEHLKCRGQNEINKKKKKKVIKPFVIFKSSVSQLTGVISHSHLNLFLQH